MSSAAAACPAARRQPPRETAVLRRAALGDVEAREHLEAARHGGLHRGGDVQHLLQLAVDAEAHARAVGGRIEMDVARVREKARAQDAVDELDAVGQRLGMFQ